MKRNTIFEMAALPAAWALTALLTSWAVAGFPVKIIRTVESRELTGQPLDLLRNETVDLRVRLLNYNAPIDLAGYEIVLHGQTNGQLATDSYVVTGAVGVAGVAASAADGWASVALDVDAWWPAGADAGTWTLLATSSNRAYRIVRAGGPLTVGGVSVGSTSAPLPTSALTAVLTALAGSGTLWRAEWQGADAAAAAAILGSNATLMAQERLAREQGDQAATTNWQGAVWALTGRVARAVLWGDMPTATVARAASADRLIGSNAWTVIEGGTQVVYRIVADTNRLIVVSGGATSVGEVSIVAGDTFIRTGFEVFKCKDWVFGGDDDEPWWVVLSPNGAFTFPISPIYPAGPDGQWYGADYPVSVNMFLSWGLATNRYPQATLSDVASAALMAEMTNAIAEAIIGGSLPVRRWQMFDYGFGTNRWLVLTNDVLEIWEN